MPEELTMDTEPMRVLETVLGWVVHAGWQAAVLGLIVLGLSWLPRRYLSADWRLGLWLVVLVRLAMPVTVPIPWSPWRLAARTPALTWHQSPGYSRESPSVPPSDLEPRGPTVIPSLPPADAVP